MSALPAAIELISAPEPMKNMADVECHTIEVLPGVELTSIDVGEQGQFATRCYYYADRLELAYVLQGQARLTYYHDNKQHEVVFENTSLINFMPNTEVTFTSAPGTKMLGITIDLKVLDSLLHQQPPNQTGALQAALADGQLQPYIRRGHHCATHWTVAHQIFNCPFSGPARNLYMQAKVLELIAHQLEGLNRNLPSLVQDRSLSSQDIDRLQQARQILRDNLDNPPSLAELAYHVGININKLKRGFKQVHGQTAYTCLHEDRMQHAHALLQQNQYNVSHVAWEVGYINVGHFSVAFKKRFGISPKTLQMSIAKHQLGQLELCH